ncbi:hypothetical protein [Streptomyces sp. DH8]|uniref:hypothetical protein n=1 Tax=Streptomyces sp. DH8 TaxID=2857008 RepID=UPI001E2C803E|nr:hypothetical protein [Streptomyces sp. DH8]
MSTETIATNSQPVWTSGLQLAMTATWKVIGIPSAQPFHAGQTSWDRTGDYVGEVHYLLLAPLREIAAAYDVPVTEAPAAGGGTTYKVVVPVDGTDVHIWTTNPADAPATAATA